jgi:hypothetical protein
MAEEAAGRTAEASRRALEAATAAEESARATAESARLVRQAARQDVTDTGTTEASAKTAEAIAGREFHAAEKRARGEREDT